MKKKVIVTAANGFLGSSLCKYLMKEYKVIGLVRKPLEGIEGVDYHCWDGKTLGPWQNELEGAYAIVNLAGRSVDCRYNTENKNQIYESRLFSTACIGQAIDLCKNPPDVWLNSASATIYRHSESTGMTEEKGVHGTGFSVNVCEQWEDTFFSFTYKNVRQIALRTTIVLGSEGGAFVPLKRLVQFGAGGRQGKGNQQFSWIHIHDFCAAVAFLMKDKSMEGPVNIGSPNPLLNRDFMKKMRTEMNVPFGLPMPEWLLSIGARIIGTETELVTKSRFIIPEKLMNTNFQFNYSTIDLALKDLLRKQE